MINQHGNILKMLIIIYLNQYLININNEDKNASHYGYNHI